MKLKKFISVVSAMAILITSMPNVGGENQNPESENIQSSTELSGLNDLEIGGTDTFGNLLANELSAKSAEQEENNGYNIFSVEVEGTTAKVSFETLRDCALLVAIYDNDNTEMAASGYTEVTMEDTDAEVEINADILPEYFYIRAYLINSDTLRPLSVEYTSPMYTKEMQEFLSKTVDDFDSDRVINFDEKKDTNFGVFEDSITIIPEISGKNTVISANDETLTYVFGNVDEKITSLKAGDIFAYEYQDNLLIVKVKTVSVSGTTATVMGQDFELEEVFVHLRIDGTSDTSDVMYDPSDKDDDVTYYGLVEDKNEVSTHGIDFGGGAELSMKFGYERKGEYYEGSSKSEYSFNAGINMKFSVSAKVYISFTEIYVECKLDYTIKVGVVFEGKVRAVAPFGYAAFSPVPGLYIGITPSVVLEYDGSASLDGTLYGTVGFKVSKDGSENITSEPKFALNAKIEVTIFVGISLEPKLTIIDDKIAKASITAEVGAEIKATLGKTTEIEDGVKHDCNMCVDGEINIKIKNEASVKLLNSKKLTFTLKFRDITIHLTDFYYSLTYNEFGFTECPHIKYLADIKVRNKKPDNVENAVITVDNYEPIVYTTDKNGVASIWLSKGKHKLEIEADGYNTKATSINVTKAGDVFKIVIEAVKEDSDKGDVWYNFSKVERNRLRQPETTITIKYVGANDGWGDIGVVGQYKGETVSYYYPCQLGKNTMTFTVADLLDKISTQYNKDKKEEALENGEAEPENEIHFTADDIVFWGISAANDSYIISASVERSEKDKVYPKYVFNDAERKALKNEESQLVIECDGEVDSDLFEVAVFGTYNGYTLQAICSSNDNDCQIYAHADDIATDMGLYYNTYIKAAGEPDISLTADDVKMISIVALGDTLIREVGLTLRNQIKSYDPAKYIDNIEGYLYIAENWGSDSAVIARDYIWSTDIWNGAILTCPNSAITGKNASNYMIIVEAEVFDEPVIEWDSYENLWLMILGEYGWYFNREKDCRMISLVGPSSQKGILKQVDLFDVVLENGKKTYTYAFNAADLNITPESDWLSQLQMAYAQKVKLTIGYAKINQNTNNKYLMTEKEAASAIKANQSATALSNLLIQPQSDASTAVTSLLPNEIYNYYTIKDSDFTNPISPSNLLCIGQGTTDENGILTIPEQATNGTVFVKAMTEFDVNNAEITSAKVYGTSVSLEWNSVNETAEYDVYCFTPSGVMSTITTADTTVVFTDLEEETEYSFLVISTVYGERSVPHNDDVVIVKTDKDIKIILADLNNDTKISTVDAKWVLQAISGSRTLTEEQKIAADVNKDGKITTVDAKWILQIVSGSRVL